MAESIFKDKGTCHSRRNGFIRQRGFARRFEYGYSKIRIVSRGEKKQDDMRHRYQAEYPTSFEKLKFYIGDVQYDSIEGCFSRR